MTKIPKEKVEGLPTAGNGRVRQLGEPHVDPYQYFDERDSQAIHESFDGVPVNAMVYAVPGDDRIVGISGAGIFTLCNAWGGVKLEIVKTERTVENDRPGYRAYARATDMFSMVTVDASIFEPDYSDKKGGGQYRNQMNDRKAETKAKRNAGRQLLPPGLMQGIINLKRTAQRDEDRVFSQDDVERFMIGPFRARSILKRQWQEYNMKVQALALANVPPERIIALVNPPKAALTAGETPDIIDAETQDTPETVNQTAKSGAGQAEDTTSDSPPPTDTKEKSYLDMLAAIESETNLESLRGLYAQLQKGQSNFKPDRFSRLVKTVTAKIATAEGRLDFPE